MLIANLENAKSHYGAQLVLNGASFKISSGEKLGLIGPNGAGKTTILRVLLGQEPLTSGNLFIAPGTRIGYVPQYVEYDENQTVLDYLLVDYNQLASALREAEDRLAQASETEMDRAMRAYQRARDEYDRLEGDLLPQRARTMLDALGLPGREEQRIESLSGGEKNVLSLTKALLAEPDLLMLDEPANHLDYKGVAWLEDFLNKFRGAVLIVSHNRYLLDRVAKGILELSEGRVRHFEGGYSAYRATKLRNLLAQQSDYIANQKRLAQLEALVKRFEQIARSKPDPKWGKRLRARKSQLEREKKQAVEKPILDESAIEASFSAEATRANIALQIRGYSKAFGNNVLFEGADVDIAGGERVALIGPNGSGKTTLLRDIIEHGDWNGDVIRIGPSMQIGYSAQEQEILQGERTLTEEMRATEIMSENDAFAVLSKFKFEREDTPKRVADLSGGERNRLQLAKLMVQKANFLILDEPTNHLDIPTSEAVEEALESFEGTILVVSHDRYFLDKVVNRVIEVRDGKLESYAGNFSEYWRASMESLADISGRISRRGRQRERPRVERAAQRTAIASLEQRIREEEQEKLSLENQLAEAFASRNRREGHRVQRRLDRVTAQLEDLYDKWFEAGAGGSV